MRFPPDLQQRHPQALPTQEQRPAHGGIPRNQGGRLVKALKPVDFAARESAACDLDTTFFVEAAAGTGKTTALVARIVSIVTSRRARVREVVAITFTEKAAGELKMRLREELEQTTPRTLADLDQAHITTIHSFCAWILRERPVEAAVDPQFAVADNVRAQLLFDDAWDEWFERQLAENPPALRRAILREFNLNALRTFAELLYKHRDAVSRTRWPRSERGWPEPLPCDLHQTLTALRDAAPAIARGLKHCMAKTENYYQQAMAMLDIGAQAGHMAEERQVGALCGLDLKLPGKIADFDTENDFREFKTAIKKLNPLLTEFVAAAGHNLLLELAQWLCGFVEHLQRRKHDAALLDFDDLLLKTRNLLRDNLEVRRELQSRFKFILVDEFQDTDPVQTEIVTLLDEGRPGKLFIVGDPKQSIYSFRGADIELYAATRREVEKRGRVLQFQQNFRSASTILDWVNTVFSKLIVRPADGDYQPGYITLAAAPHLKTNEPHVTLLRPDKLEKKPSDETRREEGEWIARYLTTEQKAKRLRWADVVMLFRSFTGLEWYADALVAHGIPFRIVGGRGYYQRQEIETLIALLCCLDNPADSLHLVAALRSPLFGWTDEQVFFASQTTGLNYTTTPNAEKAFALLDELYRAQHDYSVAGYVEHVLARTHACEVFMASQPDGAQCVANLLKALDLARQMEAAGVRSMRAFVRHLRETIVGSVEEEPSPANEETDDVVRILTIHKSKGLQFPIVVLPDLGGGSLNSDDQLLVHRNDGRIELRFSGCRTNEFDALNQHENMREEAEEIRLLYVAATRAQQRLIIPWFAEKGERIDLLLRGFKPERSEFVEVVEVQRLDGALAKPRSTPKTGRTPKELIAQRQAWLAMRKALFAQASKPLPRISPSKLAGEMEPSEEEPDGIERERAMDFGSAVHAALEQMNANVIAASKLNATDRRRATEIVERALKSDLLARANGAEQVYRELPFALATDDGLMEGKIDLLFCKRGKWTLVDYKTDARVEPERYSEQLRAYEKALKQVAGIELTEKLLFFLVEGKIIKAVE
jgi:ATP-dependent exoDNAse (exonuclease V) beta subunit